MMNSSAAYVIENAAVLSTTATVLRDLEVAIPDRRITVLIGPGGGGKSTLLNALSGRRMPGDLRLDGSWRFRDATRSRWAQHEIMLLQQRRAGAAGGTWRDALASAAAVLLLDEPCARASAAELAELAARMRDARSVRTVVIATHNMAFARAIADYVVLLCGGTIDCAVPASTFFDDPPTPMARRIISQGNCWPTGELPNHFRWVSPSLAGMARPGLARELERDLAAIAAAGITLVVSLTEEPLAAEDLARHGLAAIHFPVRDMGVPRLADTIALCDRITGWLSAGSGGVAVHCHAGLGRTGTILASQLVHGGRSAHDAIRIVRTAIRNAIQTADQEEFVHLYETAREARS